MSFMKWFYTSFVAAGMFLVRMVILALMSLLQLTVGGAEIRPTSQEMNGEASAASRGA